jgi:hypothetical protein
MNGSGGGGESHRTETAVRRSWILHEAVTWSGKLGHVSGYREFSFVFFWFLFICACEHHRLHSGAVDAATFPVWVFSRFIFG